MQTVQIGKGWFPEESGGLNRYYHDLVRWLAGAGVGVTGLVAGSNGVARGSGGQVRSFAPRQSSLPYRLSRARVHTREALRERPGSVVVAHFALYAAPSLGVIRNEPLVVHFHGPWAGESRVEGNGRWMTGVKQGVERAVYRRAERCVVLSRAFGKILEETYRIPASRIRVVPGGVDTARFDLAMTRAEARRELDWPTDRPIALVVRRLVRRMGLENLITSIRQARTDVPDMLVVIAGSGPLAGELEARALSTGVGGHVKFVGYLPDEVLPTAYRAADLSVVPSVALEGFGLVVAESLAAGTPVLVTPVGGLPETVRDLSPDAVLGGSGPIVLGAGLADALLGRIPLPSPAACVRFARERFDWSAVGRQVSAVYAEAS